MDIEHGQNHRATQEDGNEDGHDPDHEEEGAASTPPHTQVLCTESQSSTLTDTGRSFKLAGRGIAMEYWEQVFLKQCGLSFRNATLKPQASSTFKLSRVQTHKILSTHYTGKADFP